MVLLTANKKLWIEGHHDTFSKGYQRKIKHDIKKKLEQFHQVELPLLIQKGLVSISDSDISISNYYGGTNTVTTNCNVTSNCNNKKRSKLQYSSSILPTEQENKWAGSDEVQIWK